MVDELEPPRKSVELEDAGAHPPGKDAEPLFKSLAHAQVQDIPDVLDKDESSDEGEQFTDASEGHPGALPHSGDTSPVPKTRVERVDDRPAHGEVPGTAAYKLRSRDAVPDEVEVIPEGQRSRASSRLRPEDRPSIPGGIAIPKIVAEKVDPDQPAYGDIPGTSAYELRKADAKPDEIVRSPDSSVPPSKPWDGKSAQLALCSSGRLTGKGSPTKASRSETNHEASLDEPLESGDEGDEDEEEEEGFGDDFDDFEEGQEAEDFGDFGEGEDIPAASTPGHPPTTSQYPFIVSTRNQSDSRLIPHLLTRNTSPS